MDFGSPPTSSSSDGPSESQIVSQVGNKKSLLGTRTLGFRLVPEGATLTLQIQGEVQLAMMQEYISVSPSPGSLSASQAKVSKHAACIAYACKPCSLPCRSCSFLSHVSPLFVKGPVTYVLLLRAPS